MWLLLAQATTTTPDDLKGWFGAWAVSLTLALGGCAWLARRLARSEARNDLLSDRLVEMAAKIEPAAAALVHALEQVERR